MYAEFDTPADPPRPRRRLWVLTVALCAVALVLAIVTTVLVVEIVLAPKSHAQHADEAVCVAAISPTGVVTGAGPGNTVSGPAAILGFNYAYYVQHSATQAREFLTADAAVGPGDRLQAGIDSVPADTRHCVTISPLYSIGDAELWSVTVTEYHSGSEPYAPRQVITTRTLDGATRISAITRA